jgi:AcrR family transcriptional regulator
MAGREYRMRKRAEDFDATRERIVEATADLHRVQGVAATSYVQIAERAGVGAATVYRHFPTLGSLVTACGASVWREIDPPVPGQAAAVFAGLPDGLPRLERLAAELDAFYARATGWLAIATREQDRVPELRDFLAHVDAGVEALLREAVGQGASNAALRLAMALLHRSVWETLLKLGAPDGQFRTAMPGVLLCILQDGCPGAPDGDGHG